jgi:hypothetical protein
MQMHRRLGSTECATWKEKCVDCAELLHHWGDKSRDDLFKLFIGDASRSGNCSEQGAAFFSYDHLFRHGWDQYLQLYRHCAGKTAIGDASTSYSRIRYHPATIDRIKQFVPRAKILYMVRNPLERMESAYFERLATPECAYCPSINEAVRQNQMIIDSSRYWEVFEAYRKGFGEDNIRVVWFEEYISNTDAVVRDVCSFLNIDASIPLPLERQSMNSRETVRGRIAAIGRGWAQVDPKWDPATRKWVLEQIRDDNLRFLAHWGRPPSVWPDLC